MHMCSVCADGEGNGIPVARFFQLRHVATGVVCELYDHFGCHGQV